jgi:hypothetical protein
MQGVFVRYNSMTERDDYLYISMSTSDVFARSWALVGSRPMQEGSKARAGNGSKAEAQGSKAEAQGSKAEAQGGKAEAQGGKAEAQGGKAEEAGKGSKAEDAAKEGEPALKKARITVISCTVQVHV